MQDPSRIQARSNNELVNLATPLLQLMLRVKAGIVAPSGEMRHAIESMLKNLEEQGAKRGYKEQQLQNAKFALVALVDETVLAGGFTLRDDWALNPMQLQYFKEALAGNKFYERLDGLLREVESEADVAEIYYLCLLLGFKGKYAVFLEDQLPGVINHVAEHLRRAGRLRAGALSPHGLLNDQPDPPPPAPELPRWIKLGAAASVGVVALAYLLLNWSLISTLTGAMRESLLK